MFANLDPCLQSHRMKADTHEYKDEEDAASLLDASIKKEKSVKSGSTEVSDDHSSHTRSSRASSVSTSEYSSENNNNIAGHNSNVAGHNSNVAAGARNKNTNAGSGSAVGRKTNEDEQRGSLNVVEGASLGFSGAASMTTSDNLLADMVDVLMDILEEMRLMRKGTSNERLAETNQEMVTIEWQEVSTVIDRACFVIYSVINIVFATVIANRRPAHLTLADIVLPSEI